MPIINPLHIYLLSILDTLKSTLGCIAIIGLGISAIAGIFTICECKYKEWKERFGWVRKLAAASALCAVMNLFVPSTRTAAIMIAASYTTPENIQLTKEAVKDTFDYIIDKLKEDEHKGR